MNHPFVNGNKRIGLEASLVFLVIKDEYVKDMQDFRVGDESLYTPRIGCSARFGSFDLPWLVCVKGDPQ